LLTIAWTFARSDRMDSVVEILKGAIENEIKAKVFYGKASEITEVGESQMVFLELSEMEDGHARLLVERFGDLFAAADFDAASYVAAREAETEKVLGIHENAIIERGSVREALEFAIDLEERARATYLGLVERVDGEEQKAVLRELADEEQKHHDMLSKVHTNLDTPPEERPAL
jgi:rubrerythrin